MDKNLDAPAGAWDERVPGILARQGFCAVALRAETASAVASLHAEALRFFEQTAPAEKTQCRVVADTAGGGKALLGWNAPSAAKELFRVFRHVCCLPISPPSA
jgi:hypothetical protein